MVIKLSGQGQSKGHKLHGNRLICQMSNFEPHSQTENLHFPSKPTIFHAKTGQRWQKQCQQVVKGLLTEFEVEPSFNGHYLLKLQPFKNTKMRGSYVIIYGLFYNFFPNLNL